MLTWLELRRQIRTAILADAEADPETGEYRWSDDELLIYTGWALNQLALHTALATSVSYVPIEDGYPLPDELLIEESLDVCSIVRLQHADGTATYLDPVRYTPELASNRGSYGFYTHPDNVLNVSYAVLPDDVVWLDCFMYYPAPFTDTDAVNIPKWAEMPTQYLIGAHACSAMALKTATIRRWNQKVDSGTPIQNPLIEMQKHFMSMYERQMAQHPRQDRINHYRNG